jgi:hypothetical protein
MMKRLLAITVAAVICALAALAAFYMLAWASVLTPDR